MKKISALFAIASGVCLLAILVTSGVGITEFALCTLSASFAVNLLGALR